MFSFEARSFEDIADGFTPFTFPFDEPAPSYTATDTPSFRVRSWAIFKAISA